MSLLTVPRRTVQEKGKSRTGMCPCCGCICENCKENGHCGKGGCCEFGCNNPGRGGIGIEDAIEAWIDDQAKKP